MKVFTSKEFIEKLKWLVYDVPNYYHSQAGTWCNYNPNNKKFMMDCVVSIKGLLWGFKADKNLPHGGGIYGSNGVADFGANQGIKYCTDVSQNFNNLVPGEYLCMEGTKYGHAGIYIGNGKVFECTAGWHANKCIISDINNKGERIYNGVKGVPWTYHGKLIYIDYSDTPEPSPQKSIDELAQEVIDGKWGNNPERKQRLEEAGYDYYAIQKRVNELMSGDINVKYLNLSPKVNSWTVYKTNNYYIPKNTSDVAGKLNPMKFGGLSYKILQDMGNYHFKIQTTNFGTVYIAGNPNKYDCSITTTPVYKNGNY